jgi:5-formyltetrahydrofolate cyclo-ligase
LYDPENPQGKQKEAHALGNQMTKSDLRQRLLEERAALSRDQVDGLSRGVVDNLRTLPLWSRLEEVLIYAPIRNEVNTLPLLDELWERGVRILLPRCRRCAPGEMEWAPATCHMDLRPGSFAIPEPDPQTCPPEDPLRPDCIVLPGVAFDRSGYRLGYGGGFYDRFLGRADLSRTAAIGLAFSFQLIDRLPRDPWDHPVDIVVTDKEILWPKK